VSDLWARGRSQRAGMRPDAAVQWRQSFSCILAPVKISRTRLTHEGVSEAAGVGASAPHEPARAAALGPKSSSRRPQIPSRMLHGNGEGGGHHRWACCSCGPLRRVAGVLRSAMAQGRYGRVCSGAASPQRCARALGAHHSRGSSPAPPGRDKAGDESQPVRERCNGCAEGGPD
jgi:hypothetical protein